MSGVDSKIYNSVDSLPEQIEDAINNPVGGLKLNRKICICGMGASALAGDVLADYVNDSSNMSIHVVRGTELPGWVDDITTVIAVSYSGDSKEVLIAYEEARARGSDIICLTNGGELFKRCRANGNRLIHIPDGMLSREAFGYMVGHIAMILEEIGFCPAATELKGMIPSLKAYRDKLMNPGNTLVDDISGMILGKIPVIYSLADMRSSAIRWKTQINENSKILAFCGSIPEFNHNEILGWTDHDLNKLFMPIILYDDDASNIIKCMTDVSTEILQEKEINLVSYHICGKNSLEKSLKCMILGDFVSIRLVAYRDAGIKEIGDNSSPRSLIIRDT